MIARMIPRQKSSAVWRESFVRTYLERDIPQLGPRVPAETLRRFWTMLAHVQGGTLNAAQLARGLAVDGKTIVRFLDLLVDLLLVRRLSPPHANVGKRLVKSPKVYIRDSGIVHPLLGLRPPCVSATRRPKANPDLLGPPHPNGRGGSILLRPLVWFHSALDTLVSTGATGSPNVV